MKKILVIGSANMDLTIHTDRMPKLGETVNGYDFSLNSGGKGANQAVAVAKLGGDVKFLGAVGNDAYGQKLLSDLNGCNVEFAGLKLENTSTGTASITVINGDNFIILNEGANACITPQIIDEKAELIKEADYLIMQLEIPVDSVIRAAEIAKESNTVFIFNPAPYKELPESFYGNIDYIIPNEHEAYLITGIEITDKNSCIEAVNLLKSKGIPNVIITLGEKGCVYNKGNEIIFCEAVKTSVKDTTSAGDTFIGALCCKLAENAELSECVAYATKAAAITVSRNGASSSIPYAHEI